MPTFGERIQHAWNAFLSKGPDIPYSQFNQYYSSYGYRPDRVRFSGGNERSIVTSVYEKISIDVAQVKIKHVRLDEDERYKETIDSKLNNALTISANKDQTARAFIKDLVVSMFDEGCVAVVPVDTTVNPYIGSFDIETLRTGKILDWRPDHVKVKLYNDRTGRKEEIWFAKSMVAIIENPFYSIMNEPNSTLKRLIRKLNILDAIDEQSGAGKLDLIIQLPYVLKGEAKRQQAEQRRKDIEMQLMGSKYGIAYIDQTEHITQINRAVENNLMSQIQYLTSMLYSQLGLTEEILNGTANEQTMLNYYNRTIEPILAAIVDEFKRKFLTKTAITQKQSIVFIRDPFKLVPVNQIAEIADKFTRNEIASTNEMRAIIGWRPADDPRANELRNKNLNQSAETEAPVKVGDENNAGEDANSIAPE